MIRLFSLVCLILSTVGCLSSDDYSGAVDFAEEVRSTLENPLFLSDPLGRVPRDVYPIDPLHYFERLSRVRGYIEAENCERAEPLLRESIADFQDDSWVWYFWAKCLANQGRNAQAISAYKEALSLGTHYFYISSVEGYMPEVVLEIAKNYALIGDLSSAHEWLSKTIIARNPGRTLFAPMPEFVELLESDDALKLFGISSGENLSRREKWEADIAYLKLEVLSLHYDPDFKTEAAKLSDYLNDLVSNIDSLTDKQIAAKILIFAGMLGSGHDLVLAGLPLEWIEAKAYIFSDGLFFIDSEDETLIGAQILQFGEVDASEAFNAVLMAVARDNNMSPRWTGMRMLMSPDVLQELGVIDDAGSFTITIRDANGVVRTFEPDLTNNPNITPALAPNRNNTPLYLSDFQSSIWYTEIAEDTIYINVNTLFDRPAGIWENTAREISALIDSNRTKNVILDARNSQGGSNRVIIPLIRSLVRFDTSDFKESLFILIGRNTFSSAQILIGELDVLTNPIFVGEPSGGRQTFNGNFGQFRLPHSGIIMGMPTELGYAGSTGFDHRIWIAPDIPISLNSEQYFRGEDPALQAIKEIISLQLQSL